MSFDPIVFRENTRFHVTAKDIREGCRVNTGSCPVARAIARKLPNGFFVRVGTGETRIFSREGLEVAYLNPNAVWRFIHAYDRIQPVRPFSFKFPARKH